MCQSESMAMWEEATVRLGELGFLRERRRIGKLKLRSRRLECVGFGDECTPCLRPSVHMLCEQ